MCWLSFHFFPTEHQFLVVLTLSRALRQATWVSLAPAESCQGSDVLPSQLPRCGRATSQGLRFSRTGQHARQQHRAQGGPRRPALCSPACFTRPGFGLRSQDANLPLSVSSLSSTVPGALLRSPIVLSAITHHSPLFQESCRLPASRREAGRGCHDLELR